MTEQMLTENFGKNVKNLRKQNNLSQEKLAERVGVSKNTISEIENGKKFIHARTLVILARELNTEVYELFKPENTIPDTSEGILYKFEEDIKEAIEKIKGKYVRKIKESKKPKRSVS